MTTGDSSDKPVARGRCPNCGKPTDPATRPFCSKRCADVDLHRWFSGGYSIPVVETDDLSDEDLQPPGRDGT